MRQVRSKSTKKRNIAVTLLVIALIAVVAGAVIMYTAAEAGSDKILRNVYVDGIRIGGMKTAEAAEILDEEFSERRITVVLGEDEQREFSLEELGLQYKTDVIVGEAYGLGKGDSFGENVMVIFSSFFKPKRLSSSQALVSAGAGEALMEYVEEYNLQPTESGFEVSGDKVVVTNGMNGREVDVDKLMELIEEAKTFEDIKVINAPVNIIPFVLPDADDIYKSVASEPKPPYGRNSEGEVTA
ncbi:MAG: peptidoglycan binding domain-containing protein, partial [Clostridia bacterium]